MRACVRGPGPALGWGQPGGGGPPYLGGDCRLRPSLTEGQAAMQQAAGRVRGAVRWPAFQSGKGRLREGAFPGGAEGGVAPRKQTAQSLAAAGGLEREEAGGRGEGPRGFGEIGVDLGWSVSQFPGM